MAAGAPAGHPRYRPAVTPSPGPCGVSKRPLRCGRGHMKTPRGKGQYRMRKVIIMIVSAALGVFGLVAGAGAALAAGGGTVITVANTPFGKALVLGSGKYKGGAPHDITSDFDHHFGGTTGATKPPHGPSTQTRPPNDRKAQGPAITT